MLDKDEQLLLGIFIFLLFFVICVIPTMFGMMEEKQCMEKARILNTTYEWNFFTGCKIIAEETEGVIIRPIKVKNLTHSEK